MVRGPGPHHQRPGQLFETDGPGARAGPALQAGRGNGRSQSSRAGRTRPRQVQTARKNRGPQPTTRTRHRRHARVPQVPTHRHPRRPPPAAPTGGRGTRRCRPHHGTRGHLLPRLRGSPRGPARRGPARTRRRTPPRLSARNAAQAHPPAAAFRRHRRRSRDGCTNPRGIVGGRAARTPEPWSGRRPPPAP